MSTRDVWDTLDQNLPEYEYNYNGKFESKMRGEDEFSAEFQKKVDEEIKKCQQNSTTK